MIITGPLVTRLHKDYRSLIGRKGRVLAVSSVCNPPKCFKGKKYKVCVFEFEDGERGSFQVASEVESLLIGDEVEVVIRFGFKNSEGLRLYLPKVVKI